MSTTRQRLQRHEGATHDQEGEDQLDVEVEVGAPGRRTLLDRPIDRKAASVGKRSLTAEIARKVRDARRGLGESLPYAERARLQRAFAADLGDVRIHVGPAAQEAARVLGADAFTIGRDIYFAAGRFAPGGEAGMHLLAHEVAHAVQGASRGEGISDPSDPHEVAADRAADAVVADRSAALAARTQPGALISRAPATSGVSPPSGASSVTVLDPSVEGGELQVPRDEVEARYIDNHIVKVTFYENPLITSGDPRMKALEWFTVHYQHGGALFFRIGSGGIPVPVQRKGTTVGSRVGDARVVVEARAGIGRDARRLSKRGGYFWPAEMNQSTVPELTAIATSIRQRHIMLAEMFQLQEALGTFAGFVGASAGTLGSNPMNSHAFAAPRPRGRAYQLSLSRSALQRAANAREEVARLVLQQMEQGEGGHSLGRHGPDVPEAALQRRLQDGVAPDGAVSPAPASTKFSDHQAMLRTRMAAAEVMLSEHQIKIGDGSTPPKPGERTKYDLVLQHPQPIDEGFVGSAPQRVARPDGRPGQIRVYGQTSRISGVTRTFTRIVWSAQAKRWEVVQHFPVADGWNNTTQSYEQPAQITIDAARSTAWSSKLE